MYLTPISFLSPFAAFTMARNSGIPSSEQQIAIVRERTRCSYRIRDASSLRYRLQERMDRPQGVLDVFHKKLSKRQFQIWKRNSGGSFENSPSWAKSGGLDSSRERFWFILLGSTSVFDLKWGYGEERRWKQREIRLIHGSMSSDAQLCMVRSRIRLY